MEKSEIDEIIKANKNTHIMEWGNEHLSLGILFKYLRELPIEKWPTRP